MSLRFIVPFIRLAVLTVDVSQKSVGDKEESGHTHAQNVEPITFWPDSPHRGDLPVSGKCQFN